MVFIWCAVFFKIFVINGLIVDFLFLMYTHPKPTHKLKLILYTIVIHFEDPKFVTMLHNIVFRFIVGLGYVLLNVAAPHQSQISFNVVPFSSYPGT